MLWDNDPKRQLKNLLLDFMVKSKNDLDRDPAMISLKERKDYIDDFYVAYQPLKDLLLDFIIMYQHEFRDKNASQISFRDAIDYINDFCVVQHELVEKGVTPCYDCLA